MSTVNCRSCGTSCLGKEPPDDCNNCNPIIQKLIQDVSDMAIPEDDEWGMAWTRCLSCGITYGKILDKCPLCAQVRRDQ